jgi:lipopolysaccharide/colanic/teichoic acid biosynthesis glycosyltransferase
MYKNFGKRILDFIISLIALIVLSPIFIIVAILVRIKLGGPVIFKQKRPGKDGKIFTLYKFRTMTDKKDENGNLLPDSERLTQFGKMLRSTSLDELPELFNILKGDMSIVGPRPQLVRDMVFMTEEQNKRHSVRQGLTGLAQVNGRNAISWEEKINYDLKYIEKITLKNDLKICFLTVKKVFAKEDISTEGMDTAEDLGDYLLRTKKITKEQYDIKQKEAKQLLEDGGK